MRQMRNWVLILVSQEYKGNNLSNQKRVIFKSQGITSLIELIFGSTARIEGHRYLNIEIFENHVHTTDSWKMAALHL